jgi:chorismate mutase
MANNFGISEEERTGYTFPMSAPHISETQEHDKKLMTEIKKDNNNYELNKIKHMLILTRDRKNVFPNCHLKNVVGWYHEYLCHPGSTCTEATIRSTMTFPVLTYIYNNVIRNLTHDKYIIKIESNMVKYTLQWLEQRLRKLCV